MDDFRGTPILGNLHVWAKRHGSRRRHGSSGMVTHLDKCSSEFWDAKSHFQQSEFHPSGHDTSLEAYFYLLSGKAISRSDLTWDLTCCLYIVSGIPTPSPPFFPVHQAHQGCPSAAKVAWSPRSSFSTPWEDLALGTSNGAVKWAMAAMGWFTLEMGHVR